LLASSLLLAAVEIKSQSPAVQKDAQDAIFQLKNKS
jgi:hypothetical protein